MKTKTGLIIVLLIVFFETTGLNMRALEVFPGAQGYGSETVAGRGSVETPAKIYTVTSLGDSNPTVEGEFRYGVETLSGPRVIVFAVSGVIELTRVIRVRNTRPYLTIAGQTAPYPGITIKNTGIDIQTHDVLVQHIAIRPGARPKAASGDWSGLLGFSSRKCILLNAVAGVDESLTCYNVVFDHVSTSWGTDENVTFSGKNGVKNVTFSNSLNYEALRFCGKEGLVTEGAYEGHPDVYDTVDGKVVRVKNASINGIDGHSAGLYVYEKSEKVSLMRNIFAYNRWRNPLMAAGGKDTRIINNLIFAPGESSGHRINVGNLYPYGSESATYVLKASADGNVAILHQDPTQFPTWSPAGEKYNANATQVLQIESTAPVNTQLFLNNNRLWHPTYDGNWVPSDPPFNTSLVTQKRAATQLTTDPFDDDGTTLFPSDWTPAQLEEELLAKSGARPLVRDLHDKRLIKQIRERRLRDWTDLPSQSLAENWTDDIALTELAPDGYQTTTGFHELIFPDDPQGDSDGDGYTNLEEWLHAWSTFVESVPSAPLDDYVPISDNFEDGSQASWIASNPAGWSIVAMGTPGSSDYKKVYSQTDISGEARSILANTNWAYQTIQADLTPVSFDGAEYNCGILGRYRDADNHYSLVLRDGTTLELRRVVDGTTTVVASTNYTFTAGVTHRLTLTLDGPQLIATASAWDASTSTWSLPVQITGFDYKPIANGNAGIATYRAAVQYDSVFASHAIAPPPSSPPAAPATIASTSITYTGFTATWSAVTGATAYRLDVSTSPSFDTFLSGYEDLHVGANLSHAISDLSPATTYYFRVRAIGLGGTSDNAVAAPAVTPPLPVAPPLITSSLSESAAIGVPYVYVIAATNSPDSHDAAPLPDGLAHTSGTISGTPVVSGTYNILLTASNLIGSGTATLVLSINDPPPVITNVNLTATGTVGSLFNYQVIATNSPDSYAADGLPADISINPGSGRVSGIPADSGTSTVTLTATNNGGTSAPVTLTITINPYIPPPVIGGNLTISAVQGAPFSYAISASNNPTAYTATALPDGLSLDSDTGVISGTPAITGNFTIALTATNEGGTANANLTIAITPPLPPTAPPVINSLATITASVDEPFTYQVTATNDPVSYFATGLPPGLNINTATGAISGYPALIGKSTSTLTATNAVGSGTMRLLITIEGKTGLVTLAGTPAVSGTSDGINTAAQFNAPGGVAAFDNAGNIYIADTANHAIRRISPEGVVITYAGKLGAPGASNGIASAAQFNSPSAIVIDAAGANLYVADTGNHAIRKINIDTAEVSILAGLPKDAGSADGDTFAARFDTPSGLAIDATGNLYVADTGNNMIRKIVPATGAVTTLAGASGVPGTADGAHARFDMPTGLAMSSDSKYLYIADTGNSTIRRLSLSTGIVETLAGVPGETGSADGSRASARFNTPQSLVMDAAGNLYIADTGNDILRKVDITTQTVTTVIGTPNQPGSEDGIGAQAAVKAPAGMAIDPTGNIYLIDTGNHTVRILRTSPTIVTSPSNRRVSSGAKASFNVVAAGSPPPSYQWHKNGTAIINANNSTLDIAPVSVADSGSYTVSASNQMGAVQSAPAVLVVDPSNNDTNSGHVYGSGGGGGAPSWMHLLSVSFLIILYRFHKMHR